MSCRTLCSRSGVPTWPRKYLLTTTLVASWLQNAGTSTSFCSNTVLPVSLEMPAVRYSHCDLVVGVDARARPAALERQAAGALAGEAGPVDAPEALAGAWRCPSFVGCPRLRALGCRLRVHHGDHLTNLGHCRSVSSVPAPSAGLAGLRLTCRLAVTGWGDA